MIYRCLFPHLLETFMNEKKARPYKNPQINLRIPEELKNRIQRVANVNNRSMNAEIVNMLENSVKNAEIDLELYKKIFGWDVITPLTPENFGEEEIYTFTESELEKYIEIEIEKFKISFLTSIHKSKNN